LPAKDTEGLITGLGIPYLGSLAIESAIARSGDQGEPFVEHKGDVSSSASNFDAIVEAILAQC
jgi:hypothetical protein